MREHPRVKPNMVHPGRDPAFSADELRHVRALIGAHSSGVRFALGHGDETAIEQGVPPAIRYRAMFWATLHRTAMNASHYLAMIRADDAEAQAAAQKLADEMRDLIVSQLQNSRESIVEIEAKASQGTPQ